MADIAAAYGEVKQRWADLVRSLSEDDLQRAVPACPAWTVQDVLAHHVGVITDALNDGFPELGDPLRLLDQWRDADVAHDRDAMTARQVEERRGRSVADLVEHWDRTAAHLLEPPEGLHPLIPSVLVNDVVVHEGDVREALGLEVAPEVAATSLALAGYGASFDLRLRQLGLPAIAFSYGGKTRQFGDGDPAATVAAERTTLVRMLASRLDADAIRRLDWSGDPDPYVAILPEYGPVRTH